MTKWVYLFEEGSMELKSLLGGKGAGLADMKRIGLPVSNGFTVTTAACTDYYVKQKSVDSEIIKQIFEGVAAVEALTQKQFGGSAHPLLVSVRSGAVFSMPGMMDTILNLGLNDDTVKGLAELTQNERFAYDCYRRFIQMYADVVLGIQKYNFEHLLEKVKLEYDLKEDTEMTAEHLKLLVEKYKGIVLKETRKPFPMDPKEQLVQAVESVFNSWNNPRAIIYRNLNDIPHDIGTAVTVQEMVFGNMGDTSGTGVAFTRNPSTGEDVFYGEYLMNAQGEDVVAGIRTPQPISRLEADLPEVYEQFVTIAQLLEDHYKDVQDIEFTIERGKLYMLQTRSAKRTAQAALKIAVDLVEEKVIDIETALMRVKPEQLQQLMHPTFDTEALKHAKLVTKGLPASPGAASGAVYFTAEAVVAAKARGEAALLVRMETSPEDIEGMVAANGVLTARGGMTSHAAVVARGMGRCCVAGCHEVIVEEHSKKLIINDIIYEEGQILSLDGSTGGVYLGEIKTMPVAMSGYFGQFLEWADTYRTMKVFANADCAKDAAQALKFGAEGIGLCRTEHMFFEENRIPIVRRMIVSVDRDAREEALEALKVFQKSDFKEIYNVMASRPVTIRLLDPPLHEFLPTEEADIKELAHKAHIGMTEMLQIVEGLKEFNPMLGHRGVRLAITYPEIYAMQVKAIIEAAIEVSEEKGIVIVPEIMIPLIGFENELKMVRIMAIEAAEAVKSDYGSDLNYHIGTMIEVPRAALLANKIAEQADFFSFGTNDLTQMTLGFSRDDAGKFIGEYVHKHIFEKDPFEVLDIEGVGQLIQMAVEKGRTTKPGLKVGICGEHGGEPKSIAFCYQTGLDYVSCSPYRVPVARLAAAQAVLDK